MLVRPEPGLEIEIVVPIPTPDTEPRATTSGLK